MEKGVYEKAFEVFVQIFENISLIHSQFNHNPRYFLVSIN